VGGWAQLGMPLLVHGEVVDAHVDIFDREKQFLHEKLAPLQAKLPQLKVRGRDTMSETG
jgi:dihydroorotase